MFGVGRRMSIFRTAGRFAVLILSILSLLGATVSVAGAAPKAPATPKPAAAPQPADFGPQAAKSADLAIDGWGDAQGYHLELGREAAGFAWQEIALIHPAGFDDASWTGYQCLSGDGKFAALAILPASAVNTQAARDHGAFAYSVDLASGAVRALAGGVGLKYYSPGCGTGDAAVFTVAQDQTTRLLSANLATGKIDADVTAQGQITSAVPTANGIVGVAGSRLVSVPANGKPSVLATVPGDAYQLRPTTDGGLNFLHTKPGSKTATAAHEHAGAVTTLGTGDLARVQLFQGRAGRAVLAGANPAAADVLAKAGVTSVKDAGLARGATSASLDGDALLGPDSDGQKSAPVVLAPKTGKLLSPAVPASTSKAATAVPTYSAAPKTTPAPQASRLSPKADAAAAPNITLAQSPKCAVPPLNANRQVMQPSPAQVNWAVQMAEQGLLTGSAYTRPAGYANMGLVAYAPNSDFPLIPLSHPAGGSSTVPRSIYEGIMAQESNWSQASWHAPAGTAGDPLIASYYGAGGDIVSINYAASDCGYGIGQVTDGMHIGDHSLSEHGQWKVAVDYQENISAGLQILENTWNQLYAAGITANNADPRYLENWYFAAWAYNSGVQPNAANGNTTGCTPGPTCTGPHGTWGLGWTNNPANLDYPPNRDPYLQDTYADAAHPASWPYQERVLGWTASPLIRYGSQAYAKPTYNGGQHWVQPAPYTTMCTADNHCDPNATNPTNPGASHCMLDDFQCWWHAPVTWIPSCSTTCATSPYAVSGGSEPANPTQNPPTCNQDTSKLPAGAIIVDDEPNRLNLQGCGGANWSNNGTFTYTYGTNSAGDPIGAIDTHQLGTGLGGRVLFTHTENGANPALINTGVWTPNLPSLQYYKIKLHLPGLGAQATNVVYNINPGGGVSPWKIRVNQAWNSEQWVTIGTFAMQNGGNVTLNNNGSSAGQGGEGLSDYDVAFDAVAFVPQGGTPGQPIGGPPGIQDAPKGSNPAWVNCACGTRTAGDPVDTSTGYFGDTFTDLSTPGRGKALEFTRSYAESIADPHGPNGASAADGPFGWGWNFTYNLSTTADAASGAVTVHQEDGSQVAFTNNAGVYAPSAPRYDATLVKNGSSYVYTRRGTSIYTFDVASGHLTAESDLAGSKASPSYQTSLSYDGSGHLAKITDPGGRSYMLAWTGNHVTGLSDTAGRQVTYGYDAEGNLTDVRGVGTTRTPVVKDDDHEQYGYAAGTHLMTSMRTPKNFGGPAGAVTAMTYDSADRVTQQTDPAGGATTFVYGPDGGLADGQTLTTDPSGHQTLYTYQNRLLVSETKGYGTPDAGTSSYSYDPVTLGVIGETDPDGGLWTYTYDDHGNRTSASNPLGLTSNYAYDDVGNLIESIDPSGVAVVNQYDQAGHVPAGAAGERVVTSSTMTKANNVVESTTGNFGAAPIRTVNSYYDDAAHPGDRSRVADPRGNTTTTAYDGFGDVVSTTDRMGGRTLRGYDTGTGRLTSIVDANGAAAGVAPGCTPPATGCTALGYDAWGNVVSTTDPMGHRTLAAFDADGNQTSSTDGNSKVTGTTFDAAGRAVQTTLPDGAVQKVEYNPDGTVAAAVDGAGNRTTYGYDGQGRQVNRTDPDHRTTASHLDPAGRLTTTTDAAGRTTTLGHDAAGQPSAVSYSDGVTPGVRYTYDPDGRRATMTDGSGTSSWSYDAFGEVTRHVQGSGAATTYAYDDNGNRTGIGYPGTTAKSVTQVFDKSDRPTSVTDWNGKATGFGYDAANQLTTATYPNGDVVTNAFDPAGQLSTLKVAAGGTTLASMTYGRDGAGQPLTMTPTGLPGGAQTYTYTDREQLKSSTTGTSTAAYTYDAAANPTTTAGSSQAFDAAGQICWALPSGTSAAGCAAAPAGATAYQYNAQGDRISMTPAGGSATTYGYDQADRLTSVSGPAGAASYAYDGTGLRTTKTAGATTNTFTWDDGSVPNLLSDGVKDYVYGPGGVPIEQVGASGTEWFFHDALGSTRALLGANGAITGSYAYDPNGRVITASGAASPIQYAGGYTDAETGFSYLRARYYDPVTTQFLTVDPLVDATRAAYTYASNNPLTFTDPSGLCETYAMGKGGGYRPGGQSGPQLSKDEQEAVDKKNAGDPSYDRKAYNRAQQKIKQAEKYAGDRNKQKRDNNNKNNFANDVLTGLAVVAVVIVAVVVVAAFVSGVGEAVAAIGAGLAALFSFAW